MRGRIVHDGTSWDGGAHVCMCVVVCVCALRPGEEDNLPAGAVIEGKAKKYKQEDTVQYTDLQVGYSSAVAHIRIHPHLHTHST